MSYLRFGETSTSILEMRQTCEVRNMCVEGGIIPRLPPFTLVNNGKCETGDEGWGLKKTVLRG